MPYSVPWKLQKSSISIGKIFLLSDPGFDLNQMPFLVPNEGSFPLGVTPWHNKNSSGGNATGLGRSQEEAKKRQRERERGDVSKRGQTVLGTFSTLQLKPPSSEIWYPWMLLVVFIYFWLLFCGLYCRNGEYFADYPWEIVSFHRHCPRSRFVVLFSFLMWLLAVIVDLSLATFQSQYSLQSAVS